MLTAMLAVKNILGEQNDIWQANTERAYYEEIRVPRVKEAGQSQLNPKII